MQEVTFKDSSKCTLRLNYAKLADIEQGNKETASHSQIEYGRLSTSSLTLILKVQREE